MRTLRNLRLSARLGGAFGLVALLLLAIAVLGATRASAVKNDVNDLAQNKMRAAAMLGEMKASIEASMNAASQHLYVYDGDLEAQDALGKKIASDIALGDKNGPELIALMKGTSAAGAGRRRRCGRRALPCRPDEGGQALAPGDRRRRRGARRLAHLLPGDPRPAGRRRRRGRRQGDGRGRRGRHHDRDRGRRQRKPPACA
jgi:hypothetical protein